MNYFEWESWLGLRPATPAWRAVIATIYGLPMSDEERLLFARISGGRVLSDVPVTELLVIAGRRGGKSEMVARIACFEAGEIAHGAYLAPGQRGWVKIIGPERKHGKDTLDYVKGIASLPKAKKKYRTVVQDEIVRFDATGIAIGIDSCDSVSVRGSTNVMVILEERAFYPSADKAMPESEILAAIRPTLIASANVPPRRLISITSAYAKEGQAYEADRDYFGKPDAPFLVLRGDVIDFRPTIDRAFLAREEKIDPRRYRREYFSEWQELIVSGWFGDAIVTGSIDQDRRVPRPYVPGLTFYVGVDAATKRDKFAVAVACSRKGPPDPKTGERTSRVTSIEHVTWLDPVALGRELLPTECCAMVARVARAYGTKTVYIDQHASTFLKQELRRFGLHAIESAWTGGNHDDTKQMRFKAVRDAMVEGSFRLPNIPELIAEFRGIRSKALSGGAERLEGKHDDLVSSCVLAATLALRKPAGVPESDLTAWELHERDRKRMQGMPYPFGGGRF